MRTKQLLSIVLTAVLLGLLTACGTSPAAESQPQSALVRYDHPIGISLSMAEGFEIAEVEGILAGYQNRERVINVVVAEELYESLENVGLESELTLEEYGQLLLDSYGIQGSNRADSLGQQHILYEKAVEGQQVRYYAYLYQNDVAFWTVTFMCKRADAPELEEAFSLWASTVQIPAEAVTAPYVP